MASTQRKYVFEEWSRFRQSEMSSNLPDAYYDALKECFFAGSIAMIRILNTEMIGSPEDDKLLADVRRELIEFVRGIEANRRFDPDSFKLPIV